MDYINDLHELCDAVSREIAEMTEKIRGAGKMSSGDLEAVDKLTHSLKSIKAVIAMMEDDGYSGRGWPMGGSYRYGGSYRGSSYAKRNGMGRYSRDAGMVDELRDLMQDAPEDIKRDIQRIIEKVEH